MPGILGLADTAEPGAAGIQHRENRWRVGGGCGRVGDWVQDRGGGFFLSPDASLFPALASVANWSTGQSYDQAAVSTFLQVADYYLVAQAYAGKHTVVTHEVPSASTRRIKIPDACIGLGIKCLTPYEMLRNDRARFVLGPL